MKLFHLKRIDDVLFLTLLNKFQGILYYLWVKFINTFHRVRFLITGTYRRMCQSRI